MKRTDVEIYKHTKADMRVILDNNLSFREYSEYCRKTHRLNSGACSKNWQNIWDLIKEKFRLEKDKLVGKHLEAYWRIYDISLNSGDITNARQALNDIAKLQGLYEPDKMEIKQDTIIEFKFGGDDDITTDEIQG